MKILLCIRDNKTDDATLWTKRPQAGDVIEVTADDTTVGEREKTDLRWRLLYVSDTIFDENQINFLIGPEMPTGAILEIGPTRTPFEITTLQYRAYRLDWSDITDPDFLAYMADTARVEPSFTLSDDIAAQLKIVAKPPVSANGG